MKISTGFCGIYLTANSADDDIQFHMQIRDQIYPMKISQAEMPKANEKYNYN